MDGSSSKRDEIRKGPWKAEEDEVLINHVRKYGPRDWSSIRSKGLLQRTGKSCRLRWVNKLRPNLKNGCKFSAEEERIVIELQSQFGNKWARIATYLPGRTDNDVKNFWSSRQKRLQRILQSSAAATAAAKPQKIKSAGPVSHDVPANEAPKLSSSTEEDESSSSKARCFSMDNSDNSKMMFLSEYQIPIELDFKPYDGLPSNLRSEPLFPQMSQTQGGPLFLPESQDFLGRLEEPNLFNSFAPIETSEIPIPIPIQIPGKFPPEMPFLEMSGGCRCSGLNSGLDSSISEVINDRFFEDFPTDMLDDVGSPPHCPARSGC